MDELIKSLADNAPGIVGVIIVVVLFIRYLEKRDKLFSEQMESVADRLQEIEEVLSAHIASYQERGKIIEEIDKNTKPKRASRRKSNKNQ